MNEQVIDGEVVDVDESGQEPIENHRKTTGEAAEEDIEMIDTVGPDDQQVLPGHEVPRNKPVEAAALRYKELRDERIGLGRDEKKAKDELIGLMKRDNIPVYVFDGLQVKLTEKPNVKVINEPDEDADVDAEVDGEH